MNGTAYRPGDGLNRFVNTLPPNVSPGPTISGIGSPEGVIQANPGTIYLDTAANQQWVKAAGVAEIGWERDPV